MSFSRYSKLTLNNDSKKEAFAELEEALDPSAGTRFFLHSVSAVSSLVLLLFIFTLNQIGPEQFAQLSNSLENISFLNVKLSESIIKDLAFNNPIVLFILIVMAGYGSYAVIDLQRKRKAITKQIDKTYFNESTDISYSIHILLLLLILLSSFLNYHPKPKIQVTEIEFIPNQVETRKPPPVTKRRAEKQSVSAGKHDPKKPVTPVSQAPGKPKAATQPKESPKPEQTKQAEPKPIQPPKPQMAKPQPSPAPAPKSTEPPKPRNTSFLPNSFTPPSPKTTVSPKALPRAGLIQSQTSPSASSLPAPRTYSSTGGIGSSASGSGTSPAPKFSSGSGSGETSNLVARIASIPRAPGMGGGGAGGNYGGPSNPDSNNNPNDAASLGARADIEFGPYMSALQRKIKMAWKPPRGMESNRIQVMFTINKSGYLQNIQLVSPSRSNEANAAALDAVKRAAPFDPLPPGSPPTIDIEFTFDYNVFKKERW